MKRQCLTGKSLQSQHRLSGYQCPYVHTISVPLIVGILAIAFFTFSCKENPDGQSGGKQTHLVSARPQLHDVDGIRFNQVLFREITPFLSRQSGVPIVVEGDVDEISDLWVDYCSDSNDLLQIIGEILQFVNKKHGTQFTFVWDGKSISIHDK
jgi:hypothetical protein